MDTGTRPFIGILAGGLLAALATVPVPVGAAEPTSVLSSGDPGDPFDGTLTVRYGWDTRRGRVSREFLCTPGLPGCPGSPSLVYRSELATERTRHRMDIDVRLGLWHDLEFFVSLPLVLGDRTNVSYAPGVTPLNSTVDPASGTSLLDAGAPGHSRSGFGDMTLGLRYAPLCQWRHPEQPNLALALAYTAPTGRLKTAQNGQVGMGLHGLRLDIAGSRRFGFVEPYLGLFGQVWIPGGSTLFRNWNPGTQGRVSPGPSGGLWAGTEWFPWIRVREDGRPERFVAIDVGIQATYTFAGREQTDLFEALGNSPCRSNPACVSSLAAKPLMAYDRTLDGKSQAISFMDGVTDVSPYGTVGVHLGVTAQPVRYTALSLSFQYARETSHFLTWANTGVNSDATNRTIELSNNQGVNEYNPVYNSDVDEPGRRLRSDGVNVFQVLLTISGRL